MPRLAPSPSPLLLSAVAVLGVGLLGTGCSSSTQLDEIQSQIGEVQRQLLQLQLQVSTKEELEGLESRMMGETEKLIKPQADTKLELDRLASQIEQLKAQLEDTNYGLAQLSQRIAATNQELKALRAAPSLGGEAPPPVDIDTTDPEQLYQTAYNDYLSATYDLAILGFRQYLETFPDSDQADNALYWIGESYFAQGKFPQAIQEFGNVQARYPNSERLPSAILKKGYAYLEERERTQGVNQLRAVIRDFPRSDEAKLARQLLQSLGLDEDGP